MNQHSVLVFRRRDLLSLAMAGAMAAAPWRPSLAAAVDNASPLAPVARLDDALLAAMKTGAASSFDQRYRMLAPVIDQVFDLNAVLAASVGLSWARLSVAQQAELAASFKRYTVASYVSNFDSYKGQSFEILPSARQVGNGEVVVATRLIRRNDSPVQLNYVMRQGASGWRVVDVLTDGSISRVAVQRSDFRQLLVSGGVPALTAGLGRKVASLSGGMAG